MADEERPMRCARRRMERRERSERRSLEGMAMAMAMEGVDEARSRDADATSPSSAPSPPGSPPSLRYEPGQGFGSSAWQVAKRHSRQTVPFSMTEPVWLTTAGGGGCCISDLQFVAPVTVAELSFQNFYAATMDVLVCKPSPPTAASTAAAQAAAEALRSAFSGDVRVAPARQPEDGGDMPATPPVQTSAAVAAADAAAMVAGAAGGKGESVGTPGLEPEAAEFLRSLGLDLDPLTGATATWEVSVRKKQLMPYPHFEIGSQDRFSVLAKESVCPWTELLAMRLVLRQPSPSWTVFGVSSVVAYRDPAPPTHRKHGRDAFGWEGDAAPCPLLAAVRRQTEAALAVGMAEQRNPGDDHHNRHGRHRHSHPASYEFFQLPKC